MSASQWEKASVSDGVVTFRLKSWSDFYEFIEAEFFSSPRPTAHFLWRGHRRSDWLLATTLDRLFGELGFLAKSENDIIDLSKEHLETFTYAARGRRGINPPKLDENEWWALGQHFGLATPLLDWTRSPFAAAYFAFEGVAKSQTEYRAIYALNEVYVRAKNRELIEGAIAEGRPPVVDIIDPLSDENPRLVNQGGLFTRGPIGLNLETWVAGAFEGTDKAVLLKIEIPDAERGACLRALNRMNINHLSLFPDLMGASRFTNLNWELS